MKNILIFLSCCFAVLTLLLSPALASNSIDSTYQIQDIDIIGHQKTKTEIILRELTFKTGDILSEKELQVQVKKSQENLYNLLIFNRVTINYTLDSVIAQAVHVHIEVIERWYILPAIVIQIGHGNINTWLANPE